MLRSCDMVTKGNYYQKVERTSTHRVAEKVGRQSKQGTNKSCGINNLTHHFAKFSFSSWEYGSLNPVKRLDIGEGKCQ